MTKGSETSSYSASTDEIPLEAWKQVLLEYFQASQNQGSDFQRNLRCEAQLALALTRAHRVLAENVEGAVCGA